MAKRITSLLLVVLLLAGVVPVALVGSASANEIAADPVYTEPESTETVTEPDVTEASTEPESTDPPEDPEEQEFQFAIDAGVYEKYILEHMDVHIEIPDSFWDEYFEEHPITVPEPTEPALGVPEITDAHYTHSRVFYAPSNLKIKWTAVEGAESYEVLITLANGEMITYMETDISVYDTNVQCPQSYSNGNGHIAYVKVRAIAGDVCGEWSAEETISCNAFHFGG